MKADEFIILAKDKVEVVKDTLKSQDCNRHQLEDAIALLDEALEEMGDRP